MSLLSFSQSDIDECSENIVKVGGVKPVSPGSDDLWCHQLCINNDGGFECSCEPGFLLDENNQTCSGIILVINQSAIDPSMYIRGVDSCCVRLT